MTETLHRYSLRLEGRELAPKSLIGGKAWSIARMRSLGLNVPPAFVLTTESCREYLRDANGLMQRIADDVEHGVAWLEAQTNRTFGRGPRPLLVSVRSGAPVSMPGMMDTVLNLGLNESVAALLAIETGSTSFAHDTHRRFCELFARIVLRGSIDPLPAEAGFAQWRSIIAASCGGEIPENPQAQLLAAIRAVFDSWNGRRAKRYRAHHGLSDDLGTAVTIQAMVFGNSDERSGTGVLFSRNPLTGERVPYGEYLARAQGEDVVSGTHTPKGLETLADAMPQVHEQLLSACAVLERENADVQDIEFTVERGQLYLLQSRAAKRSPAAAVRCAVEMAQEGLITTEEALRRVSADQVRTLLRPHLASGVSFKTHEVVASGEAASPGVGAGIVVNDADMAERIANRGQPVVLARPTTSPEDVHGMLVAAAVITERGGSTSHAAVVSRQLGVPCVVGCGEGAFRGLASSIVTVDGSAGTVFAGALPVEHPDEFKMPELSRLRAWALSRTPIQVIRVGGAPLPTDCVDLDLVIGGEDIAQVESHLQGKRCATGSVLNTDEAVRAAVRAGLEVIAVRQPLPALLAACAAQEQS